MTNKPRHADILDNAPKAGGAFGIFSVALCLVWFTTMLSLALRGVFTTPSPLFLSWLQIAILAPMALFWIMFASHRPFRRYIHNLDLVFLTALQCLRILGLAILVMWGYGLLPGKFAIPMSLLDASVGVLAVYVVWMMHHAAAGWRRWAIALHSWGFLDFFVTIALATFAMAPLPFDPAPAPGGYVPLTQPPLSLFPSFAIPFFSCVHFAAWIQLRRSKS